MHYLFILLFGFWEGLLGGQHFKSVLSIPAQNAPPFLTSFYWMLNLVSLKSAEIQGWWAWHHCPSWSRVWKWQLSRLGCQGPNATGELKLHPLDICRFTVDIPSLLIFLSSCCVYQGVKAVIAKSFERIHRSNLVGMGIIPLCFKAGEDADTLGLTGHERYNIDLPSKISEIRPGQDVTVTTDNGKSFTCTVRFDTEVLPIFSLNHLMFYYGVVSWWLNII